jgi:hypothetical protein
MKLPLLEGTQICAEQAEATYVYHYRVNDMAPLHATLSVNIRHAITHSKRYVCQFIIGNKMSPQIISTIEKGKRLKLKIGEMVIKYNYPQDKKNLILLSYHSILGEE